MCSFNSATGQVLANRLCCRVASSARASVLCAITRGGGRRLSHVCHLNLGVYIRIARTVVRRVGTARGLPPGARAPSRSMFGLALPYRRHSADRQQLARARTSGADDLNAKGGLLAAR